MRPSALSQPATAEISGTTDVYLILGDPVEQVRAPESFNSIFARFGVDAVLVPVRVAQQDLEGFVRTAFNASNIKGMWVTIPHKALVAGLVDDCTELARIAGAVNAVRRNPDGSLFGGLFDGDGFVGSLAYFDIAWTGKKALLIGAGGAAAAIAASLTGAVDSCAEIALFDPVPGRAQAIVDRMTGRGRCVVRDAFSNDPPGYDLVVNASPLGLNHNDPMPCDVGRLEPHAALVDILMKNQPTPLVRAARARGLVAHLGFEMLIQQTPLYLEFFGFHEVAEAVKRDAGLIRELISRQ